MILTLTEIQPFFHLSLKEASKEIGISSATLNKHCKKIGFSWPSSTIKQFQSYLEKIDQILKEHAEGSDLRYFSKEEYLKEKKLALEKALKTIRTSTDPQEIIQTLELKLITSRDKHKITIQDHTYPKLLKQGFFKDSFNSLVQASCPQKATPEISYDVLKDYFSCSIEETCTKLNLSRSQHRLVMKKAGIPKWPYPTISEITTNILRIKKILEEGACSTTEKEWLTKQLTRQEGCLKEFIDDLHSNIDKKRLTVKEKKYLLSLFNKVPLPTSLGKRDSIPELQENASKRNAISPAI